jgi:hypothetical protein
MNNSDIPRQLHLVKKHVGKVTTSMKDEKSSSQKRVDMKSSVIVHKFSRVYDTFSTAHLAPLWVESVLPFFVCVMH